MPGGDKADIPQIQVILLLGEGLLSWPGFLINGPFNDAFVEGLGDCVNQGLAQAVGVSNFTADRVRRSSSILQVLQQAIKLHFGALHLTVTNCGSPS